MCRPRGPAGCGELRGAGGGAGLCPPWLVSSITESNPTDVLEHRPKASACLGKKDWDAAAGRDKGTRSPCTFFGGWAPPQGAKLRVLGWPRWPGLGPSQRLPHRGASSSPGHSGTQRARPSPSEKCFSHRKGSECTSSQGLGFARPNAALARGRGDAGTRGCGDRPRAGGRRRWLAPGTRVGCEGYLLPRWKAQHALSALT